MNWGRSFFAGVTGGLVMTGLMYLGRVMGLTSMNMEMMWGTLLTQSLAGGTWFLGFLAHLIVSGAIGMLYGAGFEYWIGRSDGWVGFGFGIIHAVVGGFLLGVMPAMHPAMPDLVPAPGIFAAYYGAMTVFAFWVLHLVYGVIVGSLYRTRIQTQIGYYDREDEEEEHPRRTRAA